MMEKLVIYNTASGEIRQTSHPVPPVPARNGMTQSGESWLVTIEDVKGKTHIVRDGEIVLRPAEEVQSMATAEAWQDLRSKRGSLIRDRVDTINAVRWDEMTGQERNAWKQYRQALLDMPQNTTDPHNPQWPEVPE